MLQLWVYTHNKKLKNNGIVQFPLSQKNKALKLFEKYAVEQKQYGAPFIVLIGRKDRYEPIWDAKPTKHEIHTGYAGKFSWERMLNEWIKENTEHEKGSTLLTGKF